MRDRLLGIDAKVARVERHVVVVFSAAMAGLVTLSVFIELFTQPESRLLPLFTAIAGDAPWAGVAAHLTALGLWLALALLGARTALPDGGKAKITVVGIGGGLAVVLLGLVLARVFPNGIVFSQRLSLSMFMWVSLLGTSMAASGRRHIVVQAAQKLVHPDRRRAHGAAGLWVAAAFTAFLVVASAKYVLHNALIWWQSDMHAGTLESLPLPVWAVTLAIPVGFTLTTLRFALHAFDVQTGRMSPYGEDVH